MTEQQNSESEIASDSVFARRIELDLSSVMTALDRGALERMYAAGQEMAECMRVVHSVDRTMIHEVLDGEDHLEFHTHYPKSDDIRDAKNGSQFYYHQHRDDPAEHGHFHLYLRAEGIPKSIGSSKKYNRKKWPAKEDQFAQLFVISMDNRGRPYQIFTNNRWVAHETFFDAPQLIALVDKFKVDHAWPSWPLNRWITAFPVLFKPQVEAAILARDEVLAAYAKEHPRVHVLEDESLEVASIVVTDFDAQMKALEQAIY